MTDGSIDYDRWYPEVPAVMDSRQLAELLNTNEQLVRAWVREGLIPAHRKPGAASSRSCVTRSLSGSEHRYEPGQE